MNFIYNNDSDYHQGLLESTPIIIDLLYSQIIANKHNVVLILQISIHFKYPIILRV